MQECKEIIVTVKDDEKTLKTKFLVYDTVTCSIVDPIISDCMEKAIKNFNGTPESVTVRINIE